MELKLEKNFALVTGARAVIGLAMAGRLATEGARVVITSRSPEKLQNAVASIPESATSQVRGIGCEGAERLFAELPQVDKTDSPTP
jgi:NADP-dependent 3-hydroxy acid dehydrogenase YdfG